MNSIIGGTSLLGTSIFNRWREKKIETPFGNVLIKTRGDNIFIQRHGSPPAPPHLINHRANIWALNHLGVQKVLSVNSVGSLKLKLKPCMFVIPDDFISIWNIPTFFDKEMKFVVPEMDKDMQNYLHRLCDELKLNVQTGGVYLQTTGPRLETKAEIRMLQHYADIVGMTMASEATLCIEYEIPYVSLCSIDNYCHGIAKVPLTIKEINRNCNKNMKAFETVIHTILERNFS